MDINNDSLNCKDLVFTEGNGVMFISIRLGL